MTLTCAWSLRAVSPIISASALSCSPRVCLEG